MDPFRIIVTRLNLQQIINHDTKKNFSLLSIPPLRINLTKQKQHRSAISDKVKRQICEWLEANESKRHVNIADYFNEIHPNLNIDRSTISKILLQSDKWKNINAENSV